MQLADRINICEDETLRFMQMVIFWINLCYRKDCQFLSVFMPYYLISCFDDRSQTTFLFIVEDRQRFGGT